MTRTARSHAPQSPHAPVHPFLLPLTPAGRAVACRLVAEEIELSGARTNAEVPARDILEQVQRKLALSVFTLANQQATAVIFDAVRRRFAEGAAHGSGLALSFVASELAWARLPDTEKERLRDEETTRFLEDWRAKYRAWLAKNDPRVKGAKR